MPRRLPDVFQALADCPDCKVEGAVLELIAPSGPSGVALESTCRMCGRATEHGEVKRAGRRLVSADDVAAALAAWAATEGEADIERFCRAHFGPGSVAGVCAEVAAGRRVETSFDVIAYLFPGMMGGGGAAAPDPRPVPPVVTAAEPPMFDRPVSTMPSTWTGLDDELPPGLLYDPPEEAPPPPPPDVLEPIVVSQPSVADRPLLAARALAAVMAADGVVDEAERRFLDAFLARAGHAPLDDADIRVWRPTELGWPESPEPIIEAMVELCFADRTRDRSEWRVVREYARHWGYPLARLESQARRRDEQTMSGARRAMRTVRRLLITEK